MSLIPAGFMLFLFHEWLKIEVHGWKPLIAWAILCGVTLYFYDHLFRDILHVYRFFYPSQKQVDLYSLAQAEIKAERNLISTEDVSSNVASSKHKTA